MVGETVFGAKRRHEELGIVTLDIAIVFAVLLVSVVVFATDKVRHDVIGLIVMVVLGLFGVLKPKELLAGFGNQAVVTIGAMFVLSTALMRTGMVAALGAKLTKFSRGSPARFLLLTLCAACFMSAFVNNTPVVVVFIPAVLTVCTKMGESPSKFLMPISFASMLGGSCTLIGTSSNILVSSLSEGAGHGPLGMFEFTKVGLLVVVAGMAYLLLFSRRFLPERVTLASSAPIDAIKEYVTQVRVGKESHLVGKMPKETFLGSSGISIVELIRGERIRRLDKEALLEVGDVLLLKGDVNKILELDRLHEISITPELAHQEGDIKRVEMSLFELMIAPESPLIGRTCKNAGLRAQFGVSVFALQRRGRHHQKEIADLELRMGDILLVRGPMDSLDQLRHSNAFILLEGVHDEVLERHKAPLAVGIIVAIVVLAALSVFPISILSLAGVALIITTRLLTPRQVYRSIDWTVLVLIAGMIALGDAMGKTGALDLVANLLLSWVGSLGAYFTLWIFYFMTAALSLLILNKPAAVLMAPLGMILAQRLGVSPMTFIMAVAFAASTAMATPMGYQTNLLVYGPGGYNYKDFLKFGLPLNIGVGVLICLLLPVFWPF